MLREARQTFLDEGAFFERKQYFCCFVNNVDVSLCDQDRSPKNRVQDVKYENLTPDLNINLQPLMQEGPDQMSSLCK